MLVLHDTLRRRRVAFRPRGRVVTLYVCGVTPYDTTHLGHARTFLVFDVLVRHLEAKGLRVKYAQNVTDIDESILQRAAQRGVDWRALGRDEERKFLRDMSALGWREPDVVPHATREIPAMLRLAERLVARGHAYELPGGLYFDVASFPRYRALSRLPERTMRRIRAQQDDARLDDPRRRHPLDFALWRRVAQGPTWPSRRFGRGRPGWHLECSAMSLRHLGRPLDIHGGGVDLVYPHHESEIAQSEGADGRPFARHWVHVGMVHLEGEKMSKSKGNMVFVRDALARVHPDGLRLYLLSAPYRRPFDHDERRLAESGAIADAVRALARRAPRGGEKEAAQPGEALPTCRPSLVPAEALRSLDDDLDTPAAIRLLARLVRAREAGPAVALARHLGLTLRE